MQIGVTETLRQADVDDVKAQQFDAQEAAELDAAALEGIGDDPDSVLVAEMLGQRLDQLPSPTIEKLGARKYGLVDETGEVLEQFSTLKQAKKSLEAEQGRIKEAAIARAKRMRDNATDQPQVWTPGGMVGESDVVGKIKFTKTQLKFLEDQGMKLPGTNYELSQTQMSEFAKGLRTLADSGQFVGQQRKMLNNMIDRLDVQVKTLEPMARAKRIVDDTVQQGQQIHRQRGVLSLMAKPACSNVNPDGTFIDVRLGDNEMAQAAVLEELKSRRLQRPRAGDGSLARRGNSKASSP